MSIHEVVSNIRIEQQYFSIYCVNVFHRSQSFLYIIHKTDLSSTWVPCWGRPLSTMPRPRKCTGPRAWYNVLTLQRTWLWSGKTYIGVVEIALCDCALGGENIPQTSSLTDSIHLSTEKVCAILRGGHGPTGGKRPLLPLEIAWR